MQKFNVPTPLGLYIHLPWCVRKCPYCDFNSHELRNALPETAYVDALIQDFEEHLPAIWGRRISTIFFGGGTPSLFSPAAIERILTEINARSAFHADIEITMEANPGTLDESRFTGFRQAGINRVSLGVQSLQDEKLKTLGRIHNREYALRAVDMLKKAGFDNFNLDFMHGLPNQSIDDALSDLREAIACEPTHLSWYQLTIEPNTFFHHHPPALPAEEVLWEIQEQGKALLTDAGFMQYEVSAYAKNNRVCAHNVNYWEFGDYLGIGAGAHSKLTHTDKQIMTRHWQVKNPRDYLHPDKKFVAEEKAISEHEAVFEFMLNALRLTHGVPLTLFAERTGLTLDSIQPQLKLAYEKKLLIDNPNILCPSELGHRFLNDLVAMFLGHAD